MYGNGMYTPYFGNMPGIGGLSRAGNLAGAARGLGLFGKLGKGFNISSILTNTQKTLGVINQAIPVVKQAGPMFNNMKTMLKLASAFNDETDSKPKTEKKEQNNNTNISNTSYSSNNTNYYNQPEFFI